MSMTVAELRKKLKEEHGFTDEEVNVKKNILKAKLALAESQSEVFDQAEMEDDIVGENKDEDVEIQNVTEEEPVVIPNIDSPEWSDYVMTHFQDDEMDNGHPTCDGLRRVTELLIGPIVGRKVNVIQAPSKNNYGTSTVCCTVTVMNNMPNHILYQQIIHEEDAADVNKYNTQEPYHMHATATATTRAEARALRKILRLRTVIAAEELADDGVISDYGDIWKPDDQIDEEQISLLDVVSERCDVNVLDYVNSGEKQYKNIKEVSKTKASEMIQHLNKIQQGKSEQPVGVGTYDANWRENR